MQPRTTTTVSATIGSARAPGTRTLAHRRRNDAAIALFHLAEARPQEERRHIRQKIVIEYLDLADAVAHRYSSRAQDWNDVRQVARVGLVKAVERFDFARGDDFASYAVPTMAGEIKRYLRDSTWLVRPPRQLQELRALLIKEKPRMTQELGRTPTTYDMAADLGESVDQVAEALTCQHGMWPVSLDANVHDDETVTLADTIGITDPEFERTELSAAVWSACSTLSERELRIVYLRFYLEQTQSEIARQLGVTQMQVSRLLSKILGALREHLSPELLAA
ncbi:MAG TPA: sigma-70 family RNA polymerase sigma factor [Microbacteriaceae bacterium]|nr:sigma-70 family RNA polymerase sigma factor [Microbacteriaceae bacterium]